MKLQDIERFIQLSSPYDASEISARGQTPEAFLELLAQTIAQEINPQVVLQIGCDRGHLVKQLRKLGIQAWGIDVSGEVISQVEAEAAPYCQARSLVEPLPQSCDLVICLECLTSYPLKEVEATIQNICQHTHDVLFSASPFYLKGMEAHVVKPPDYWAKVFARHGFYHDLDFKGLPLLPWSMRFRKRDLDRLALVSSYEQRLWQSQQENRSRRALTLELREQLSQLEFEKFHLRQALQTLREEKERALREKELAEQEKALLMRERDLILRERDQAYLEKEHANRETERLNQEKLLIEKEMQLALHEKDLALQEKALAVRERDQAYQERDQAIQVQAQVVQDRALAIGERDRAFIERNEANKARDQAIQERDLALRIRDQALLEKAQAIAEKDRMFREKDQLYTEYLAVINSNSWQFMRFIHRIRYVLIPLGSRREKWMRAFIRFFMKRLPSSRAIETVQMQAGIISEVQPALAQTQAQEKGHPTGEQIAVVPVHPPQEVPVHKASVDIVVCIHNALKDVQACLESIVKNSNAPYALILVDDGSDTETRDYLVGFIQKFPCTLVRNEQARGYTRAANQGLRSSTGDYVILLNSDTIVTPRWLDRMVACAESDPQIGVVGPLSNTASWQSVPKFESNGDWAENPLPDDLSIEQMADLVSSYSGRLYPPVAFLNGFCLMLRRQLIEAIGYLDEENFGKGYGEEDDFCLRARKAGWKLALADDVYIYHAQSKSYSHEKRRRLSERAGAILAQKHGRQIIDEGVSFSMRDRVLQGIRARSEQLYDRNTLIRQGRESFAGRRIAFVLPVKFAGGGSNIVISEARAMQAMGVDVQLLNLNEHRETFTNSYPWLDIPVMYTEIENIPFAASQFDAAIATFNTSVAWLAPIRSMKRETILGYYVQGFEPLIYTVGSEEHRRAIDSYTLIPEMMLFCKTDWVRQQVLENTGAECTVVGVSVDVDLFRPRPRFRLEATKPPVRIGAMIRAASPYRAPQLTMEVLRNVQQRYGERVEIYLFGMDIQDEEFRQCPTDFAWKSAGLLTTHQVASLMNVLDIFVDFSSHQAMGLTALEAMACGVATIVPAHGGAVTFAKDQYNSLVIDTSLPEVCFEALCRLVEDQELREHLMNNAMFDASKFYPEKPAFNILQALFCSPRRQ